ncbi:MAG TPA: ribokinase [Ktedonobacterales bacterium]|nr:ribokinase [Ktedonobacterales bacterium]
MSPASSGRVTVIASFMADLVVRAPRRPQAGETLMGTDFGIFGGGKGRNQAIAAARCGAQVAAIGRVGDDVFAQPAFDMLAADGIDSTYVTRDPDAGTGTAMIIVDPSGQNSIIITPRANLRLVPKLIEVARPAFEGAAVVLAQLEVPIQTVLTAARMAREAGARFLLNPAPAPTEPLPDELLRLTSIMLPNEVEAAQITGIPTDDQAGAERAARALLERGPEEVILTLGARGALWVNRSHSELMPAIPVQQVDSTAAGDAFCGALAAALAVGEPMAAAVRWASAAGALAVTKMGASPSLPTRAEVERLLAETEPS